ncbi:MAG: hypothetical protein AAF993_20220 [Pseudomonadota bacterium]
MSDEDGIRESIQRVAEALSTRDPALYGTAVTADLINMTLFGSGQEIVSTFSRQERLDQLEERFKTLAFDMQAAMKPLEIHISGDRAFVLVDGTLTYTPKEDSNEPGSQLRLDIYMFYWKDPVQGWQTERSMAVVRESTPL